MKVASGVWYVNFRNNLLFKCHNFVAHECFLFIIIFIIFTLCIDFNHFTMQLVF